MNQQASIGKSSFSRYGYEPMLVQPSANEQKVLASTLVHWPPWITV